jgi:hypothetical protein
MMIKTLFRVVFAACVMAVVFVAWSLATNTQALARDPTRNGARALHAGPQRH